MGWGEAVAALGESFKAVFQWATGGRTREENAVRDEIQHWWDEYSKALRAGDVAHASFALNRMRVLRDQAKSSAKS